MLGEGGGVGRLNLSGLLLLLGDGLWRKHKRQRFCVKALRLPAIASDLGGVIDEFSDGNIQLSQAHKISQSRNENQCM